MTREITITKPVGDSDNPVFIAGKQPTKIHADKRCMCLHNARTLDEVFCIPCEIAENYEVIKSLCDSPHRLEPCDHCTAQ